MLGVGSRGFARRPWRNGGQLRPASAGRLRSSW
jgi:hypothetical protein